MPTFVYSTQPKASSYQSGIARRVPWDDIPEEFWDERIAVNLKSAYLVTQAVLPGMRAHRWGRIMNSCSGAAATGGGSALIMPPLRPGSWA
jgi:3-oxoacyl-[acyl-carrier protein] reductase